MSTPSTEAGRRHLKQLVQACTTRRGRSSGHTSGLCFCSGKSCGTPEMQAGSHSLCPRTMQAVGRVPQAPKLIRKPEERGQAGLVVQVRSAGGLKDITAASPAALSSAARGSCTATGEPRGTRALPHPGLQNSEPCHSSL